MKFALGPIAYYWPRETVFKFYESIAATPVDVVYLGETVCSRRHEMRLSDWLEIAAMLEAAGKQVVLSTLILIESGSDAAALRKITGNGRYAVEANDMGAVHCLSGEGIHFVAGPHLNIYNTPALEVMAEMGATRWVMPIEMGHAGLSLMRQQLPAGMETEVFAYGRLPLAFSARCFTARHCNLPKDNCQFKCLEHPDGLMLRTREDQEFLVLNGIQTQSALVYNLLGEVSQLQCLGVDVLRISPQARHTEKIIQLFRDVAARTLTAADGLQQMQPWMPEKSCNGYWYGKPGLELLYEAHAELA